MPDLRLPGELLEAATDAFERGTASAPETMPLEPGSVGAVRAALARAAEAGTQREVVVALEPHELEAFKACFFAGGEKAKALDDARWHAILAAIDAAEGAPRPGIA
ncbi:MAG TPA: hypothetical protein VNZ61_17340 [Roseomonas sp.]|nr:hypothetical protein [Roseomonas sp.]